MHSFHRTCTPACLALYPGALHSGGRGPVTTSYRYIYLRITKTMPSRRCFSTTSLAFSPKKKRSTTLDRKPPCPKGDATLETLGTQAPVRQHDNKAHHDGVNESRALLLWGGDESPTHASGSSIMDKKKAKRSSKFNISGDIIMGDKGLSNTSQGKMEVERESGKEWNFNHNNLKEGEKSQIIERKFTGGSFTLGSIMDHEQQFVRQNGAKGITNRDITRCFLTPEISATSSPSNVLGKVIDTEEINFEVAFFHLNNRLMQISSPLVQSLLEIGFEVNEKSRELVLLNDDIFNSFSAKVRAGNALLPACWKTNIIKQLGYLITSKNVENPAKSVRQLLESKKASRTSRQTVGFISSLDESGASAAERAALESSDGRVMTLNKEQNEVVNLALQGYSVYIGGCAGTGKTVLLTALKRRLTSESLRVAMTATTGIAGCHIGGSTFHHTFSVTTNDEFCHRKNLLAYDVVVIDEISMMSKRLFEEFDLSLRHEAGIDIPFGGVQVILCGDFLQLSPPNAVGVLESDIFHSHFVKTKLIQQVRQSAHPEFATYLSTIRKGSYPPNLMKLIKEYPEGELVRDAVNLLPTNIQVREANAIELERLSTPAFKFHPKVSEVQLEGEFTPTMVIQVGRGFDMNKLISLAFEFIKEKVNIRNSYGFSCYKILADGYAFRIALPQGESVPWKRDLVQRFLDMSPSIEKWGSIIGGNPYVANIVHNGKGLHTKEMEDILAVVQRNHPVAQPQELKEGCRVLLRSNLTSSLVNGSIGIVKGFCPCEKQYVHKYLRADPSVDSLIEEYARFHEVELRYPAVLPMVQFADGAPPIAIPPVGFTIGGTVATQFYALESMMVPITLAYAFTVHKVQGLTLGGRVHLELSRMWPCEHLLYVAMSRVKNPNQLSMSGFKKEMIVANPKAVEFDTMLHESVEPLIPETSLVAMWKGFESFTVMEEFHKSLGLDPTTVKDTLDSKAAPTAVGKLKALNHQAVSSVKIQTHELQEGNAKQTTSEGLMKQLSKTASEVAMRSLQRPIIADAGKKKPAVKCTKLQSSERITEDKK